MKNTKNKIIMSFCLATCLLAGLTQAGAQKAEVGFRFMPTFSKFDVRTSSGGTISGQGTLGFGVGALIGFNFTKHVGIQGEVIYSSLAQKYKEDDTERKIKLKYINIPLLLSLNTGKTSMINLNVVAGPQIGLSVGSSVHISSGTNMDSTNAVLAVRNSDFGFAYGVGIDFGLNTAHTARLSMGYRGVFGLLDISNNNNTIDNNSYYILDKSHVRTNAAYIGLSFLF